MHSRTTNYLWLATVVSLLKLLFSIPIDTTDMFKVLSISKQRTGAPKHTRLHVIDTNCRGSTCSDNTFVRNNLIIKEHFICIQYLHKNNSNGRQVFDSFSNHLLMIVEFIFIENKFQLGPFSRIHL